MDPAANVDQTHVVLASGKVVLQKGLDKLIQLLLCVATMKQGDEINFIDSHSKIQELSGINVAILTLLSAHQVSRYFRQSPIQRLNQLHLQLQAQQQTQQRMR